MNLHLINRQHRLRVHRPTLRQLIRLLMGRVRSLNPERVWGEICLMLVGDASMRAAHQAVFGDPRVTDVISLAYRPVPGAASRWSAEIVINVDQALREGARRPGGPARELALYIAHGCHHLAGADDSTPAARRSMRARETRWLADPVVRRLWQRLLEAPPDGASSGAAGSNRD